MDLVGPVIKYIASLTPAQVCQGVYILSSATILAINALPAELRTVLVEYGARHQDRKDGKKQKGTLQGLVGLLEVPHSWFLHFYVVSVAYSAFWAWQYLTHGTIMGWLAREQVRDGQTSVELSRVFVAWGLMTLQGLRRLYESLFVTKSGSSPMSSLHWIAGVLFYAGMSISVWIEGSGGLFGSHVVFMSTLLTLSARSHPSLLGNSRAASASAFRGPYRSRTLRGRLDQAEPVPQAPRKPQKVHVA